MTWDYMKKKIMFSLQNHELKGERVCVKLVHRLSRSAQTLVLDHGLPRGTGIFPPENSLLGQGIDKQASKIKVARTWYVTVFSCLLSKYVYKSFFFFKFVFDWFTCETITSFGLVYAISAPSYSAFLEHA